VSESIKQAIMRRQRLWVVSKRRY